MPVLKNFISRVKEVGGEEGWAVVAKRGFSWMAFTLIYPFRAISRPKTFNFGKKKMKYFDHFFNTTWMNERSIEIPIVWSEVKENWNKEVLEVGNVLSYYFSDFPKSFQRVDKYEKIKGVINEDIINFNPKKKYDLIVSISTLEHVGIDESPKDFDKIVFAVNKLKKLLRGGGRAVVTVPLDYHPRLMELIEEGKINFTKEHYLKRMSANNFWEEISREEAKGIKFGSPYMYANGLLVGIIEKRQ
ncbi:MAG: hypothetical protein ABH864_01545 [archaeon]